MNLSSFRIVAAAVAIGSISIISSSGEAAVISVNLARTNTPSPSAGAMMRTSDTAGVGSARDDNWNNLIGSDTASSGIRTTDGTTISTPASLVNGDGATTTATASFTRLGSGGYGSLTPTTDANDQRMYKGYIDAFGYGTGGAFSLTVSSIPYTQYDVYIYVGGGTNTRVGRFTIGSQDRYVRQTTANTGTATTYPSGYDEGTSTTFTTINGTDQGNYARFTGLSAASFTLTWGGVGGGTERAQLTGLQIVQVPEPAALSLLGLSLVGVVRRPRRA